MNVHVVSGAHTHTLADNVLKDLAAGIVRGASIPRAWSLGTLTGICHSDPTRAESSRSALAAALAEMGPEVASGVAGPQAPKSLWAEGRVRLGI